MQFQGIDKVRVDALPLGGWEASIAKAR